MSKEKILIVDDEEDILELVRYNLSLGGYETACADTGEKALSMAEAAPFDLVVLDLMLPGIDGLEVMKRLKGKPATESVPIIMLTARGEEADVVTGLELGADDYMVKPFSPRILLARIKTILRRRDLPAAKTAGEVPIRVHDLTIDCGRHQVLIGDKQVQLTLSEFQILSFLAKRPGWVFTRTQIVDEIRGDNYAVTDRSVDVQIVGLRKKLGSGGSYIETVRGVGYRFKE